MIITKEVEFHFEQIRSVLSGYIKDRCISRELTPEEKDHIKAAWEAGTGTKFTENCSACWRKALKAFEKALERSKKTLTTSAPYNNVKAEPSTEIKEWLDDNFKKEMV